MRRPSYFQLRTGFVPDVPTPGVYPFPHLGCDQEAKEAPKCDTWITRTAWCRTADTTLSCWRCSPDRMNELAQKASKMAGRLVRLGAWFRSLLGR